MITQTQQILRRNRANLQHFTFHYDNTNSCPPRGQLPRVSDFTFHYDNTNSPVCLLLRRRQGLLHFTMITQTHG